MTLKISDVAAALKPAAVVKEDGLADTLDPERAARFVWEDDDIEVIQDPELEADDTLTEEGSE